MTRKRIRRPNWTKETVKKAIIERKEQGLGLRPVEVSRQDRGLYQAVLKHFGDWNSLYEEIGLIEELGTDRKPRGYWTEETVAEAIQERIEQGKSLGGSCTDREYRTLVQAGVQVHGSWRNALEANGLDADSIFGRRVDGYWTTEKVLQEIQKRYEDGRGLRPVDVDRGTLYKVATKIYGGWDKALEAAGIDSSEIYQTRRERDYWNRENILEFLADRHKKGYSISAEEINNSSGGYGSLYRQARKFYGSWANVRQEVTEYIREQESI